MEGQLLTLPGWTHLSCPGCKYQIQVNDYKFWHTLWLPAVAVKSVRLAHWAGSYSGVMLYHRQTRDGYWNYKQNFKHLRIF